MIDNRHIAVHVQQIHIEGLNGSNSAFVIAQLRQFFDARNPHTLLTCLEEARTRLNHLDLFRSIDLVVERNRGQPMGGLSAPYDVTAYLKEHVEPRPWLRTGCHYGNRVLLGAGVVHGNLFGRGERLEVECGLGMKEPLSGRISLSKPWLHNSAVRWGMGGWMLGARQLKNQAVCALVSVHTGLGLHTFSVEGQRRTTIEDDNAEACEERGVLRHTFLRDTRDVAFFPSNGTLLHLDQALVGAPDKGHLVHRLDFKRWIQLPWKGLIVCATFVGGLISSGGNKVPPLDQLTPCQSDLHQAGSCVTPPPLTDGLFLAQTGLHLLYPVRPWIRLHTFATADLPCQGPIASGMSWCVGLGSQIRLQDRVGVEGKFVLPITGPRSPGFQLGFSFNCL